MHRNLQHWAVERHHKPWSIRHSTTDRSQPPRAGGLLCMSFRLSFALHVDQLSVLLAGRFAVPSADLSRAPPSELISYRRRSIQNA
jgi:hypothetical protein